ncbi:MAG: FKBP-type peptidyl-prolyl cis-trans isomerase [Candidatus Nanoarchaeia archaeon]
MAQKVEKGNYVEVHYTGTFDDGSVFDSSQGKDPLGVLAGEGMLIKGFDQTLLDMEVGQEKEITITPEEAYGQRNDQLIRSIKKSDIGGELKPEVGMMIGVQAPTGQTFPAVITKVEDETVEIDANHPLAGKTLHFKLKLELAREPTQEDMKKFAPQENACSSCSEDSCDSCGPEKAVQNEEAKEAPKEEQSKSDEPSVEDKL